MKSLHVPVINELSALSALPARPIGCASWEAFPGGPGASFRIARLGATLCILFEVNEENPRTVNEADGTPVYQDSCVEFFCKAPAAGHYFNFEFNSAGACRAASRIARHVDVRPLTADEYASIRRVSGRFEAGWWLLVELPMDLIFGADDARGALLANFYKCGDLTAEPHYLSWAPISAPKPDFHRPESFARLEL